MALLNRMSSASSHHKGQQFYSRVRHQRSRYHVFEEESNNVRILRTTSVKGRPGATGHRGAQLREVMVCVPNGRPGQGDGDPKGLVSREARDEARHMMLLSRAAVGDKGCHVRRAPKPTSQECHLEVDLMREKQAWRIGALTCWPSSPKTSGQSQGWRRARGAGRRWRETPQSRWPPTPCPDSAAARPQPRPPGAAGKFHGLLHAVTAG